MPIKDGKYKNPNWVNGGPPAIDADELNAISDTLENLDKNPGTNYISGNGISIAGTTISAKISSDNDNVATFGKDGGIYVPNQGGGAGVSANKKAAVVVGSSQNGWTAQDCDYLCDGTSDDVEINKAIVAAKNIGYVCLLPGTYNLGGSVSVNNDVTIYGGGAFGAPYSFAGVRSATVIKDTRQWTGAVGSISSASISCGNNRTAFLNLTLDSSSVNRVGVVTRGNTAFSYCSIKANYHCVYSTGISLTLNSCCIGDVSTSSVSGQYGVYMMASGIYPTLEINGGAVGNIGSVYANGSDASFALQVMISNCVLSGAGGGESDISGAVALIKSSGASITGCNISGYSSIAHPTPTVYLDSTTENCIISGNVISGYSQISDNGTNNNTQYNLLVQL